MSIIGKYVEAKDKDSGKTVQGWVIKESPLIIRGMSGREYECEGEPTIVDCPLYIRKECARDRG